MASLAEGARTLLIAASVGEAATSSNWPIHVFMMPNTPDEAIVIKDTGGPGDDPKWLLDFSRIQVMVRGNENGYQAAYQKAKDIKDVLLGLPSQDLNGDRWVSVTSGGGILPLGLDDTKRPLISVNFQLIIEPGTSALTNREPL